MSGDSSDDEETNCRGHLGEMAAPTTDHISEGDGGDNTIWRGMKISLMNENCSGESIESRDLAVGRDY
ncbi:hypothetical protein TSMEX_006707 [Taenia solium]|eukprot:TsM_001016800 transcript=TsM_001016800 gene=TsM_001016800